MFVLRGTVCALFKCVLNAGTHELGQVRLKDAVGLGVGDELYGGHFHDADVVERVARIGVYSIE
ncbi:hypothetical protein AWB90_18320 [Mycobacterium paraense]|uniref:Uncharacterized protein n=1 Tax=Mycobacterium paraense TaxID=767916 RepID=A0A1X2A761_9MYCO|nr:hypothetical protein AWB90_18320 [Mycobacterium paraense]